MKQTTTKPKVYVLMLSKNFPEWHSCRGNKTHFEDKIKAGVKLNTYRISTKTWLKKAIDVMNGRAIISVREWTGEPYKTKQKELFKLGYKTKFNICEISRNEEYANKFCIIEQSIFEYVLNKYPISISSLNDCERLSREDGLSEVQFCEWFFRKSNRVECIKICFNDIIE